LGVEKKGIDREVIILGESQRSEAEILKRAEKRSKSAVEDHREAGHGNYKRGKTQSRQERDHNKQSREKKNPRE